MAAETRRVRARRLVARIVDAEGSTRSLALIRIGAVLCLWACVGEQMHLRAAVGPERLLLSAVFYAASLALLFGLATPLAAALTAGVLLRLYVDAHLGGPARAFFAHHHQALLTAVFVLLALAPAGRSLSLDRWRRLRREARGGPPAPPERGPLWPLRLLALQASAVYLWSAIDKLALDFLTGARLERIAMELYFGSDLPEHATFGALVVLSAWCVLLLEIALGVGLWSSDARRWLIPAGIALHALLYLAVPVCVFSALMVLLYLAYADPAAVDRALARLLPPPR